MKHGRKRFLAIILTILMTLQQGTLEVLAAEITPSSETAAVQQAVEPKNTGPEMTDTEGTEPQAADSKKTEQKNTNQQETSQQKSNQQEASQQQPNQQEASQQQSNQQEASQQQSNQQESNSQAANQQETGKLEPEAGKPESGQSGAGKPEAGESEETEPEEEKQPAGAQIKAAVESVEEYDLAQCITKAQLKVQIGNVFYDIVSLPKDITVPKDAPVDVKIAYNPAGIKFAAGDKLIYQIPSGITVNENQKGEVKDGPITAGTYIIQKDGKIIITLDEDYLNKHDGYVKNGTISFSGHFDSSQWGQGGKQEIVFGKDTITIPFTPDPVSEKGVLNISKEILKNGTAEIKYDETNKFYYIEYKITVSTPADNTMDMPNVTVEDIFTAGGDYIQMTDGHPDIYDIDTGAKGTFAYNTEKGVWEWTGIGDMKAGESHVLTFKVRLNNKISDSGNDVGDRTITNKAEVNSNDVMKNEASVSAKANSSLNIAKTTTGYDAATGMVSYTVKVKAEDNNTWPINNVTVDDIFGTGRTFIDKYETITLSKGNITNNADKDSDKKLVWNIGTMIPGEEVTLTYKVNVNDTIFLQGTAGITTAVIENTAYLKVNGQDKSNANAAVNFKKVWIWKNGNLQDDGRVRFVIHANETTTASAAAGDYILSELQAPEGYELAEDVPFTLDNAAGAVNKVTMVDRTIPEEFSYYGFLNITKNVLKNGEAYETDNVYYAGVFYDAEYSRMFEKVELSMNGKSSVVQKVRVPLGKNPDAEIDFYVTEVDENGKPLENGPDLKFTVTVDGTHAVLSGKDPEAEVIITNNYVDEPKTEITITNTENVRTGDETDFGMYLMLMGAAGGVMLLTLKRRKKR